MKSKELNVQVLGELLEIVRGGGAILRGQRKPSRRFVVEASGVRVIRERTCLSQSEFASLIGVSIKTLQNWEQDRRRPTGPAAERLRIIAHEPGLTLRAIHRGEFGRVARHFSGAVPGLGSEWWSCFGGLIRDGRLAKRVSSG